MVTMFFKELSKFLGFLEKRRPLPMTSVIKDVSYYSQWESSSLVDKIINDELLACDDPLWKNSGATSPEEYEFWARNMCGMACLKMVIQHKFGETIPIVNLGKRSLEYGTYTLKPDTIDGMYYLPFVKFVKKEFNLDAEVVRSMSIERILRELARGNYVVASVNHQIRNPSLAPSHKGGHLVLLLGYDLGKKALMFHNPSGDTEESQKYAKILFSQFENFFAGRGLVIKNETKTRTFDRARLLSVASKATLG